MRGESKGQTDHPHTPSLCVSSPIKMCGSSGVFTQRSTVRISYFFRLLCDVDADGASGVKTDVVDILIDKIEQIEVLCNASRADQKIFSLLILFSNIWTRSVYSFFVFFFAW